MRIYLDNAASTPLDPKVLASMTDLMRDTYGNASSIHQEGRKARIVVEQARKSIAKSINASIGEVFFTSGGTESNNMALKCAVRDLGVQRIISTKIEHHCVLHSVQSLAKHAKILVDYVQIDANGAVDLKHLANLLAENKGKTLVSLMHAHNEIGTLLDLNAVAQLCQQHGAYFHSDTVQTMGLFPIDVQATPIHFLAGSAHKFFGPKGVGFIYINADTKIEPFLDGGSQERNMRGGTENVYGIAGMALALELSCQATKERHKYLESLRLYMKNKLIQHFPTLQFIGSQTNFSPKVLNAVFPATQKTDLLIMNLDIAGISASGGSACSSGVEHSSHVLEQLFPNQDVNAVRFSFSHHNTHAEIDIVVEKLREILA